MASAVMGWKSERERFGAGIDWTNDKRFNDELLCIVMDVSYRLAIHAMSLFINLPWVVRQPSDGQGGVWQRDGQTVRTK